MTSHDRNRIIAMRDQAKRLRQIADELTAESNRLEAACSRAPLLGGRALVDAAVAILADAPGHTMHYKDLLRLIEARSGMQVRGVDPAATLLANLDRDPRVRSWGDRSGRYLLTGDLRLTVAAPGPGPDTGQSDGSQAHNLAQGDPAQTQRDRLRAA